MKAKKKNQISPQEKAIREGIAIIDSSTVLGSFWKHANLEAKLCPFDKGTAVIVSYGRDKYPHYSWHNSSHWFGRILLNKNLLLPPKEWAYAIAHAVMHLAFGHFDAENMPGYEEIGPDGTKKWRVSCDIRLWNEACDIYITKFLEDIKFGSPLRYVSLAAYQGPASDECSIYNYLLQSGHKPGEYRFGTASHNTMDMQGLEKPAVYDVKNTSGHPEVNPYSMAFARHLAEAVSKAVGNAGGITIPEGEEETPAKRAAAWFINHYPLLGGLAAGFKIVEDNLYCVRNEISIAAVNEAAGEIYVNPSAGLTDEELKFVLAHEYLHAGLGHYHRCQGREPYLWNVACDFVINGWLMEMHVGEFPARGELYDEELKGKSAEEIYDEIIREIRRFSKMNTFRGYGKGDMMGGSRGHAGQTSLDDFYRSALQQGLEYHTEGGRGYIPAGLIEEIRALAMPPIPWNVELGKWFDLYFAPLAKQRTYARPSRRQGSTPDIPRPRYVMGELPEYSRTFGVVLDTSGSMSPKLLGYALGAIASYAAAKEVPYARVVFCDADAYDAGWLAPEDIAGRVEVQGRGGTILQPGVDLLMKAKDFPKDAPILIITDGYIEKNLSVHREHAFLIPRGNHLPFRAKGKVFYFAE